MIVVDSSVWIDFFNGQPTSEADALSELLGQRPIVVGDLTMVEVLSGFRRDEDYRKARALLESCDFRPMVGREVALAAANNYRHLRKMGVTVRKTIDVLIGTFCRFSVRFCAVTVMVSRVAASRSAAGVGVGAASCAKAADPTAR